MENTKQNKKGKRIAIAVLLVLIVVAGYMVYHYKIDDTWRFKDISTDGVISEADVDTHWGGQDLTVPEEVNGVKVKEISFSDYGVYVGDDAIYIENIDVTNCKELVKLELPDSFKGKELDLTQNKKLKKFEGGIGAEELDLSQNKKLTIVYIHGNKLRKLDLSNNKELKEIGVYSSSLKKLDLSNNEKIESVDISSEALQSFDGGNSDKLTFISIDAIKELEKVDISGNKNLEDLSLFWRGSNKTGNKKMKELDISHNTELKSLVVYQAPDLEAIDLSNNHKLTSILIDTPNQKIKEGEL